MRRLTGLMLCLLLLLSACGTAGPVLTPTPSPAPVPLPSFEDVLTDSNARHADMVDRHLVEDLSPYLCEFSGGDLKAAGFTEEELAALVQYDALYSARTTHTAEEAARDVDLLFRLFRYCFALYEYYGGREAFDAARAAVEKDLAGQRFITAGRLEEILFTRLSFITDGHSALNGRPFTPRQRLYYSEEAAFLPDGAGGYVTDGVLPVRLTAVNGGTDLEHWIVPSISPEGRLVWYPGTLAPSGDPAVEAVYTLEDGELNLTLAEAQPYTGYERTPAFSASWEGVPTVAMRDFTDADIRNPFIETGAPLAEEPLAILDLRGNGGGMLSTASAWLYAYGCGGLAPFCADNGVFLSTRATSYIKAHDTPRRLPFLNYLGTPEQYHDKFMTDYRRRGNYSTLHQPEAVERAEGGGLLFVLTDSASMSCAEHLIAALHGRENTIFVGANTKGALLGDPGVLAVLPHSGVRVQLSVSLYLYYDGETFDETVGFHPDLWVGGDSLARVEALISRYELQQE